MDRLKNDMATRHIPVCVISTEEACERAASYGALRVLTKPLQNRETLEQLLDDDPRVHRPAGQGPASSSARDAARRDEILRLDRRRRVPGHHGADRRRGARAPRSQKRVDCLVLDASMPDMTPDEFLRRARAEAAAHDAAGDPLFRPAAAGRRRPGPRLRPARWPSARPARPSGCSTRPPSSSTRRSTSCPSPSGGLSSSSTRPTRSSRARRC